MTHRRRLQDLFRDHAQALNVFFRRRIRRLADTRDLTQEVYLRVLRAGDGQTIRNAEAYLFTVAKHLVKERRVLQEREARQTTLSDPQAQEILQAQSLEQLPVNEMLDREARQRYMRLLLTQLPPRTQRVLFLAFEEELSHEEIARRVGISKTLVGRIIAQGVASMRERMAEQELL